MPAAIDRYDISDLLASLAERSLVSLDHETGRYHLSESMRSYALEQVKDEEHALRERHLAYFLQLAEPLHELGAEGDEQWILRQFGLEIDNFRAACEWAKQHNAGDYLRLASRLAPAWLRHFAREGRQHLEQALAAAPHSADAYHVWARLHLAQTKTRSGDLEGVEEMLTQALRDTEGGDMPLARTQGLLRLSWYYAWNGDHHRSSEICQEVIRIATAHGLSRALVSAHVHLGEAARYAKDWLEAERRYLAALETAPKVGNQSLIAHYNLGSIYIEMDDLERAERAFREAARLGAKLYEPDNSLGLSGHSGLGYVAVKRGDYRAGGLLLGCTTTAVRKAGLALDPLDQELLDKIVALGREEGGAIFNEAFEEGETLPAARLAELIDSGNRQSPTLSS